MTSPSGSGGIDDALASCATRPPRRAPRPRRRRRLHRRRERTAAQSLNEDRAVGTLVVAHARLALTSRSAPRPRRASSRTGRRRTSCTRRSGAPARRRRSATSRRGTARRCGRRRTSAGAGAPGVVEQLPRLGQLALLLGELGLEHRVARGERLEIGGPRHAGSDAAAPRRFRESRGATCGRTEGATTRMISNRTCVSSSRSSIAATAAGSRTSRSRRPRRSRSSRAPRSRTSDRRRAAARTAMPLEEAARTAGVRTPSIDVGDLGIAADAAAHERDERARVARDVIEVRVERRAHAIDRREIRRARVVIAATSSLGDLAQPGDVEIALGREVVIEQALRDLRLAREIVDRDVVVRAVGERALCASASSCARRSSLSRRTRRRGRAAHAAGDGATRRHGRPS